MGEPEFNIVKVPTIPIHPRLIEKYEQQRAELERLLTPEALARLDAEGSSQPDSPPLHRG